MTARTRGATMPAKDMGDDKLYHDFSVTFSQDELDANTPEQRRDLLAHKIACGEAALRDMLADRGIEIAGPQVVPLP